MIYVIVGLPRWLSGEEYTCRRLRRRGFNLWVPDLEEEMTTHYSSLAWEIPGTEEPGGLQSMGIQRVRHDRACMHAYVIVRENLKLVKWWNMEIFTLIWRMVIGMKQFIMVSFNTDYLNKTMEIIVLCRLVLLINVQRKHPVDLIRWRLGSDWPGGAPGSVSLMSSRMRLGVLIQAHARSSWGCSRLNSFLSHTLRPEKLPRNDFYVRFGISIPYPRGWSWKKKMFLNASWMTQLLPWRYTGHRESAFG